MIFAPGDIGNANLYSYVNASPMWMSDPTGNSLLSHVLSGAAIGGTLSALTTGAYGLAKGWSIRETGIAAAKAFALGAAFGAIGGGLFYGAGLVGAMSGGSPLLGQAALSVMLFGVNTPLAIANFFQAYQGGDSTDVAFATINLGLAGGTIFTSRFAMFSMFAQGGPISRAAMQMQGPPNYRPDSWNDSVAHRGSLLIGSIPEETGGRLPNFFSTPEVLKGSNMNSQTIANRLQTRVSDTDGPRKFIGIYEVIEDARAAVARTNANGRFGDGGYPQIFLQDPSKAVRLVKKLPLNVE